ncbi:helix-turn-helix domain-containing protein [Acidovorax sp. NCPPB 4044]|uniref:helix-turn-helix domain-containing protein n=1 Tax=Acidovorax sp. NCPPB 4044 TaxID=2940490 RepID=UPI0023049EFF|nr:helix-turn-helix domain-containing protein [Acidovorax sp. NCPPB 4044]MDA8523701.1 helix-turn-helix domain-containing protein [Acidovorax sp. NCPPB 4044]
MATLVSSSARQPDGLIPSGQLWLARPALSACVRGTIVRSTVGHVLRNEDRINRFPAAPLCSLSWWFTGRSETLVPERPGTMAGLNSPREPMPGRWVLAGPQTRPTTSYCAEPTHAMMVMFMPDALYQLTGLEPQALTDRVVDAQTLLPSDWIAMCAAVQCQADDAARLECLEDFLEPRWQICRPAQPLPTQRYVDWAAHLAQRAVLSAPGRSLRQLERRIKRWAGLPLRELRGFGKAEQAFFDAIAADTAGKSVKWADVANGAGFSDQSHLCRVTRRITGYAPQALYHGIHREEAFWVYRIWE